MKRLSINILLFTIAVIGPLFLLSHIVNEGLKKSYITYGGMNEIYSGRASADMIIIGASRAKYMIHPKPIDSVLGINAFNIGIDGWPVHMEHCLYEEYKQHNKKPKYAVYVVGWAMMNSRNDFYNYEQFMPYANDKTVVEYTKNLTGAFTIPERYFPLFIYNNHLDYIAEGIKCYFNFGRRAVKQTYKGFMPNDGDFSKTDFEQIAKNDPHQLDFIKNDTAAAEFEVFLDELNKDGVKVIFVYPPTYILGTKAMGNKDEMLAFFEKHAKRYDIPIFDYSNDSMCYKEYHFKDVEHTNTQGSYLFSAKFASDIKPIIKMNN
jgi:hypothetical protein